MSASPNASYSPGLEGVIAGESAVCCVDPDNGLLYRGYDIDELARQVSFEDVAWLLLHGELPNPGQYESIREELADESELPEAVLQMLRLLPRGMHPVDAVRTGMSMLAGFDPELGDNSHDANLRKALRIIARTSTLITTYWHIAHGQDIDSPAMHLTHAARFLAALLGREPEPWRISALNIMLALYAEHEYNASTFSARVTASTLSDLYAAVTSALGTLKGALHGGANEEAMKMLREIGTPDRAEEWLRPRLAAKQKIMGFGHRVYIKGDSRVPVTRELSHELARRFGEENLVLVCEKLEEVMAREKKLYANLDLYAAPVLDFLGIPSDLNICVFAAARVAGWCAHVIEQHDHNRLIRPRCLYTGTPRRAYLGAARPAPAM